MVDLSAAVGTGGPSSPVVAACVGVAHFDHDGLLVHADQAFCAALGLDAHRATGRPWPALLEVGERGSLDAWMTDPSCARHGERRYRHASGRVVCVLETASALPGVGFVCHLQPRPCPQPAQGTDTLTGLADRQRFLEEVRALSAAGPVAVLVCDIDRFAVVNDSAGPQAGDDLLRQVAGRLRSVAGGLLLARHGGDEFALALRSGPRAAKRLAQRIVNAMGAPFDVDGREIVAHVSVGVAHAARGACAHDLRRGATTAMHAAKRLGGDRAVLFDAAMHHDVARRADLDQALHRGLARGEFRVLYQPKVRLDDERIVGVEALLRWQRPGQEVSPVEFIPLAEQTGVIVALGEWVLRQACLQQVAWAREFPGRELLVAVNVAARQLDEPDFVAQVARILRQTGADPSRICLELTESAVIGDTPVAAQCLRELAGLGVRLAIDDFGTGFNGLAQLKRLPVHFLKVDRVFVAGAGSDPKDTAIVATVARLADALNATVVAEGIEDRRQLDAVRAAGCPLGQGFLFARPASAQQISEKLAA